MCYMEIIESDLIIYQIYIKYIDLILKRDYRYRDLPEKLFKMYTPYKEGQKEHPRKNKELYQQGT